jgi:hypothetical protein
VGEQSPTAVLETGDGIDRLRVTFERTGEFYSHSISKAIGSEELGFNFYSIVQSRQDTALSHMACFTELHRQGETIFLTGASGPCHWSMCVKVAECRLGPGLPEAEYDPSINFTSPFIFFDVACRHKKSVANLCSEYDLNSNFECEEKNSEFGTLVGWNLIRVGMIQVGELETKNGVSDAKMRCQFSQSPDLKQIRLSATNPPPEQFPATASWSYGVQVS